MSDKWWSDDTDECEGVKQDTDNQEKSSTDEAVSSENLPADGSNGQWWSESGSPNDDQSEASTPSQAPPSLADDRPQVWDDGDENDKVKLDEKVRHCILLMNHIGYLT